MHPILACKWVEAHERSHHRSTGLPDIPHVNGVLTLNPCVLSPVIGLFSSTLRAPASNFTQEAGVRTHRFAVRQARSSKRLLSVHHSPPYVLTIAKRPFGWSGTAVLDCGFGVEEALFLNYRKYRR